MIPNIEIGVRQYPTKANPYLHVLNYDNKAIDYYIEDSSDKYYTFSIGVWKPKKTC